MKRLSIDPAAEEELRAVVARYEMQQQDLGVQFFVEVGHVLELILRHPGIGSVEFLTCELPMVPGVFCFGTSRTLWCIGSVVKTFM